MKDGTQNRCPGCGKHCSMGSVRCKYGKKYFEKALSAKQSACSGKEERGCKWEKHVEKDGLAWHLLHTARNVKHALKEQSAPEAALFSSLTEEERSALAGILKKIAVKEA